MRILAFGGIGNIMFDIVPVIVVMGFIFIFGIIIYRAVTGAQQWNKNNQSPILTVGAVVVAKRMDVSHHHHHNSAHDVHHNVHYSSSTRYYATFGVQSGDRMEFLVGNSEYGMIVENDRGQLTFQGTRYLGFERERN